MPTQPAPEVDSLDTLRTVSTIGFIAGGVLATTGPQGGKAGTAGSSSDAGMPSIDGGEPSVGLGGEGAGGAPPGTTAPCDEVNGQPPLLCDDFESGSFDNTKWMPPPGVSVIGDQGPHGATKLVRLNSMSLGATLGDLPITDAGGGVTVSFWVKSLKDEPGQPIATFRDRSAAATTLSISSVQKELGFRT